MMPYAFITTKNAGSPAPKNRAPCDPVTYPMRGIWKSGWLRAVGLWNQMAALSL